MRTEDMILVSVDDHVVEPPTLFDNHLPDKWKDVRRRRACTDDGIDVWEFEGNVIPNIGLNAVAGRPPEEYNIEPTSYDMIRDGCYDIHERVKDMNRNGVLGSMCFPSFVQFCGQLFSKSKDLDIVAPPAPRVQRLAHRRVVRHLPRPVHAAVDPADLGPAAHGRRGAARREEGLPRGHVLGEPVQARLAAHLRRPLGPVLRRVRGRRARSSACTSVRAAPRSRSRRARRST